jgi:hypothetical protein
MRFMRWILDKNEYQRFIAFNSLYEIRWVVGRHIKLNSVMPANSDIESVDGDGEMRIRILDMLTENIHIIIARKGNVVTIYLDADKWIIYRSIGVKNESVVLQLKEVMWK